MASYQDEKTKAFIARAMAKHDGRYDYSFVEYKNTNCKVTIVCWEHGNFEQTPDKHLRGQGCPACSPRSAKTIARFVEDARKIHGDKYDYSKSSYVGAHTKLTIICHVHGEFIQTPNKHLQGHGCTSCALESGKLKLAKTTEQFIEEARTIHGDKYDYSKSSYIGAQTNLTIVCHDHGEFEQTPNNHLHGQGCIYCGKERTATLLSKSLGQFIEDSKKIHGDLYDYSKSLYVNDGTKVIIGCKAHGEFRQVPNAHLRGQGCPSCGMGSGSACIAKTTDQFIEDAQKVHGNMYNYSKSIYLNSHVKIIIVCTIHGEFEQKPSDHLRGSGCAKCKRGSHSKMSIEWLERLSALLQIRIQHAQNDGEHEVLISGKKYKLDGVNFDFGKVAFEFHGDFWHGNPDVYNSYSINGVNGKTFGELYDETLKKEADLVSRDWYVITMWESDYKKGILLYPHDMENLLIQDLE